jgi:hypothetical protein
MTTRKRIPLGVIFTATLVLSWTLITVAIGFAMYSERNAPWIRLATWASLWLFSVVVPTTNAFAVHRAAADLIDRGDSGIAAADVLVRLRPVLLLTASMTALSAFALILGR